MRNHIVGLAVIKRSKDIHILDTQAITDFKRISIFGVEVGVAEAHLVVLADVHIRIEVPHMRAVHAAAVAHLRALHIGYLVREVHRGIELPIRFVYRSCLRMVKVAAVD